MALTRKQEQRLEALRRFAGVRADALAAEKTAGDRLRAAMLAALGSGASAPDVAHVAGSSRQAPHTLARRREPDAPRVAWEAAGRPDQTAALAALAAAAPPWRTADSALAKATADVARQMTYAYQAWAPPTAIVAASGLAEQAGYDYLAAIKLQERVVAALKDAGLAGRDDMQDDVLVGLSAGPRVTLILSVAREEEVERRMRHGQSLAEAVAGDAAEVAAEVSAVLLKAGLAVDQEALARGERVTVKAIHEVTVTVKATARHGRKQ
jgi:hypothetical protein